MAAFGTFTLLIALVVATYAGVASLVGARRGNRRLIASGRAGVYALAAVLGLSSVALVYAFVSHDYSIKYVHHYSDAASPLFYQITAYWGGLDGSILWWVFLLSVFSAIAIYTNRNRHRELRRCTLAAWPCRHPSVWRARLPVLVFSALRPCVCETKVRSLLRERTSAFCYRDRDSAPGR